MSSAQRERLAPSVGSTIGERQGIAEGPAVVQLRAIDDFEFKARDVQDGELLVARGG
jgi:hypothetical protein